MNYMNASEIKKLIKAVSNKDSTNLVALNRIKNNLYEIIKDENTPAKLKNYDYIFEVEQDHIFKFDKNLKMARCNIKSENIIKVAKQVETKYCQEEDIIELLKGEISVKEFFKDDIYFQLCLQKGIDLSPRVFFEFINNFKKGKIDCNELPVYLFYYSSSDILMFPCSLDFYKPKKNNYLKFTLNCLMLNYYFQQFVLLITENDNYLNLLDNFLIEFQRDLKNQDKNPANFEMTVEEISDSLTAIGKQEIEYFNDEKDKDFYQICLKRLEKEDSRVAYSYLSDLYIYGDNFTKVDYQKSLDYSLKAYQKGENALTYRIGALYKGVFNDDLNFLKYINIANNYDVKESYLALSDIYFEGKLVNKDYKMASKFLDKVNERYYYKFLEKGDFSYLDVLVRYIDIADKLIEMDELYYLDHINYINSLYKGFFIIEEKMIKTFENDITKFNETDYKEYLYIYESAKLFSYSKLPNLKNKKTPVYLNITKDYEIAFLNGYSKKMCVYISSDEKYIYLSLFPQNYFEPYHYIYPLFEYGYIYSTPFPHLRLKVSKNYKGMNFENHRFDIDYIKVEKAYDGFINFSLKSEDGIHIDILADKIEIQYDEDFGKLTNIKDPIVFETKAVFNGEEIICLSYSPLLEKGDKVKGDFKEENGVSNIGIVTSRLRKCRLSEASFEDPCYYIFITKIDS